uniref:Vps52 C-terminal domain-containing protein n=1 Tax=Bigelowiella natans TaxID=227086 RepID=A0A7S2KH43_BIGNA
MKKPQTNIQIKQNLLLRFKYLYIFCRKHAPTTAEEIQTVYIDTIKKIYTSHFKLYLNSLMKLRASSVVTKGDLLGLDEAKSGGMFSLRKSKLHLERVFMLGNRDAILSNIDKPPIIYHTAAKRGHKFPYQEIFRTTHRLLMDTATTETAFIADFFTDSDAKISGVGGDARWAAKQEMILFESIFNKTTSLFIENLEQYLSKTYDCLELLILVRVVSLHTQMMRQRQTECLDMFFDRINMLLWPRFKVVLDSHLASIKNIRTNSVVSRGDMSPFFLSPRYAEFASGIDILNKEYQDSIITSNMGRIREAVGKLLETLAVRVGSDSKRTEIVFLINNYDTILKVFDDKNLESETAKSFKEKLHNQVAKYVEMELRNCFSKLIEFVRSSEQKVAEAVDKKIKMPTLDLETGAEIVRSFRQGWQNKVAQIDLHVNSDFSSRNTGHEGTGKASEILKQILIQLVLYYQRLQEVVKKCYRRSPSFMKDLVPIPTIMHEIKKYGSSR